jgi:hypothetical protein
MSLLRVLPDEKAVSSTTKKPVKRRAKISKKWGIEWGI